MSATLSSGSLFWTFVLTLIAVLCMATSAREQVVSGQDRDPDGFGTTLTCGGTACGAEYDLCCHTRSSLPSGCCSSNSAYIWALKGTGITLGALTAVLLACLLYSCWRKRRMMQEHSRMTSIDDSWDTPPDYNSLKKTFEKEPPGYYKLYPIPVATASSSKESSEPPPPTYDEVNISHSSKSKDFPRLPWKKNVSSVTSAIRDNKPEISTK